MIQDGSRADGVLQAIGVGKTFPGGVQAIDAVSLTVRRGETLALIGESGSGKSTLLRMFNRLEEPDSGQVLVRGTSASEQDPIRLRRSIGYIQQDGGLLPHWTVARNIGLVPQLLGWDPARRKARTDELLALVDLPEATYRDRYPAELSGGQRQRVAFARALAADAEVILLDEPFGALDALTRLQLQKQFLELKQQLSRTMLLVTHDLDEAFLLADRVGVMKDGRILQVDTPAQLRSAPQEGYVSELLQLARQSSA